MEKYVHTQINTDSITVFGDRDGRDSNTSKGKEMSKALVTDFKATHTHAVSKDMQFVINADVCFLFGLV